MANLDQLTERSVVRVGGSGDEVFAGSADSDILEGGGGDDTLSGGGDRDHLLGGSGNDILDGGDGRDILRGGSGNDFVDGGAEDDFLMGDTGDDHIVGGQGWDRLFGGEGRDILEGGGGEDVLIGGAGDDLMSGGAREDHFVYLQNAGDDIILDFELGTDFIDLRLLPEAIAFSDLAIVDMAGGCGVRIAHPALHGSIELKGIAAADLSASDFKMPDGDTTRIVIDGAWFTAPDNSHEGSNGAELIINHEGDGDTRGNGGQDRLFGGEGDDCIDGGSSADALYGEEGDDILEGGYGADRLFGGEGDDRIDGGDSGDLLVGGEGDDALTGGAGADRFVFGADHGNDAITDFGNGADVIDLSGLEGVSGFDDLTVWDVGTAAVVDLTGQGGGTILLQNTDADDLDALDFVFHEPPQANEAIDGM